MEESLTEEADIYQGHIQRCWHVCKCTLFNLMEFPGNASVCLHQTLLIHLAKVNKEE